MQTPSERSPYGLIQEDLRNYPWRLLVCCILLNLTSRKQAEPVWNELFRRWPNWMSLLESPREVVKQELVELFKPLGLQNKRADSVIKMTEGVEHQFRTLRRDRSQIKPRELYGIGKYGADSYEVFIKGKLVDDVKDKELRRYYEWAKERSCADQA